jgi:hypothetical protein
MNRRAWIIISLTAMVLCMSPVASALTGTTNLWLVQADGSGARRLTNFTDSSDDCRAWDLSPDGRYVIIALAGNLRAIDLHGNAVATIPTGAYLMETIEWHSDDYITGMSWYGDGQRAVIGFQWPDGQPVEIYAKGPSWLSVSPDRQWLVDAPSKQAARPMYLVRLADGVITQLPCEWSWPHIWAPDSSLVALEHSQSVGVVDTSGRLAREIEATVCIPLGWTPDAKRLILYLFSTYSSKIVRLDQATGAIDAQVPVRTIAHRGCPSPDGSRIAFTQNESEDSISDHKDSLWVSDWSSPGKRIMNTNGGDIWSVKWLPDGSAMIVEWESESANPKPQLFKQSASSTNSTLNISSDTPDFRSVRWGMTMEEVTAAETEVVLRVVTGYSTLAGDCVVAGHHASVFYEFTDSQLSEAFYAFLDAHTNDNLYIDDFEDLKGLLTLKYGPPVVDTAVWKRNLYRNDPDKWGFAVLCGDLKLRAEWDAPRTRVVLYLTGDNYEAHLWLTYTSKLTTTVSPDLKGL